MCKLFGKELPQCLFFKEYIVYDWCSWYVVWAVVLVANSQQDADELVWIGNEVDTVLWVLSWAKQNLLE